MTRARWTTPALDDLAAIGDVIARNDPAAATKAVATVLDCAEKLAWRPQIGRIGRIPDTRELIVARTRFVVPYRVRGDEVQILAVFDGAGGQPEAPE